MCVLVILVAFTPRIHRVYFRVRPSPATTSPSLHSPNHHRCTPSRAPPAHPPPSTPSAPTDVAVGKHWLVEVDPDTRRMADKYSTLIGEKYPHRSVCGEDIDYSLPQDVEEITEAQIQELGRIDITCCAWPCQGLSRAARHGQGLEDKRSGLFWPCARILKWVRKHNPHAEFMFENVDFGTRKSASMQAG